MPTLSPTLRPQAGLIFGIIIILKIYDYDFFVAVDKVGVKLLASSCKTRVQLLAVHGFCHSLSISLSPRCVALSTAINLEESAYYDFGFRCET
jgi:hypothetical protein